MLTSAQLRSEFLEYFRKNGHTVVDSSSLVPQNDPTLLFTNAGMVQFKDVFLGTDPRPYKRATTSQKCVRAGGKHNDLENVGFTARHHTFFEMLGNFSFGDYFKKDAIHFAWEFVTKSLKLDKSRLSVSVYKDDDEAAGIWEKQEGVPRDRIHRFGEKDNFWSMGETGPCGPCSEIFVDRGAKYVCGKPTCGVGCDCDRFMEIWNLVFMQFERSADGKMAPLPKPSIDTGMGLERLASVIQDVDTNYDTDLFLGLIRAVEDLSRRKYQASASAGGGGTKGRGAPGGHSDAVSFRVLADHCRATNFLVADGVLPSNEGRGYVLRRIMRRAIRHGRDLGFREPFFFKLTVPLIGLMGEAYPELRGKREYLESTIRLEEERFLVTLENGLRILEEEMRATGATSKNATLSRKIDGQTAFKLYDTFGFPLDLTQVIARERGFDVDEAGFNASMQAQRDRSREHWKGSGEEAVGEIYKQLHQKGLKSVFRGYETLSCDGKVLAVIEENKPVEQSSTGSYQLVLDQTPFYAESGGQVGDRGEILGASTAKGEAARARVTGTRRPAGELIVLSCEDARGSVKVGDVLQQRTDRALRGLTAKNHTATHILHHALRKYLGPHVKQAGSLVNPELLRFDFTHPKALASEEIDRVEDFINDSITDAVPVQAQEMEKDKALAKGAIAFFGDKYGARVRVVSVGDYSVELCGGTHVHNTSDIQAFKIVNESGVAAGVRRIVAMTGPAVPKLLREKERRLESIMRMVKASAPDEVPVKIEKMQAAEKELRRALETQSRRSAAGDVERWIAEAAPIGPASDGGRLIRGVVSLAEGENAAKRMRDLADEIRSKTQKAVVALGASDPAKGQALLLVAVTKDWGERHHAGEIIRKVAPIIEGSGGGKPDLAQAGGKAPKFDEAFEAIEKLLDSK